MRIKENEFYMMWRWVDGHPQCYTVEAKIQNGKVRLIPLRSDTPGAWMLTDFYDQPDPKEVPGYE